MLQNSKKHCPHWSFIRCKLYKSCTLHNPDKSIVILFNSSTTAWQKLPAWIASASCLLFTLDSQNISLYQTFSILFHIVHCYFNNRNNFKLFLKKNTLRKYTTFFLKLRFSWWKFESYQISLVAIQYLKFDVELPPYSFNMNPCDFF